MADHPNNPVTVIAEIGLNHGGDMATAMRMIKQARDCGADIAKFQSYRPHELLGPNSPYLAEAIHCQFPPDAMFALKEYCDQLDIEFGLSIFHVDQLSFCEHIGLKRFKIASRAMQDPTLVAGMANTRKPLIASCGLKDGPFMASMAVLERSADVTFLHCVAKYPAELADFDLSDMFLFGSAHSRPFGLSSHYPGIAPTLAAVACGASVVENHVCISQNQSGCDIPASITFDELAQMVKLIREMEKIKL